MGERTNKIQEDMTTEMRKIQTRSGVYRVVWLQREMRNIQTEMTEVKNLLDEIEKREITSRVADAEYMISELQVEAHSISRKQDKNENLKR